MGPAMKWPGMSLVQAPIAFGSLIAGVLVLIALVEMVVSNPRWDDHLLNALGVLGVALFVGLTLHIAIAAFRPQPGTPRRARLIRIMWLVALVVLMVIVISVAIFINNMSFL